MTFFSADYDFFLRAMHYGGASLHRHLKAKNQRLGWFKVIGKVSAAELSVAGDSSAGEESRLQGE
ncbi:hypothetical protein [Yersinia mollaretii]|uniref:hypothetical protein n=1 Tax=Yersinia mollaretii TaxID=33060 RepID=UPI00119EAA78|nr:hypothetical protein [Yersinia mollaretii]